MMDFRVPALEGLAGYAFLAIALYAALMGGLLLLGHLAALAQRGPRGDGPIAARLPGLLIGIGIAFGLVVLSQALTTLSAGATVVLDQVPQMLRWP